MMQVNPSTVVTQLTPQPSKSMDLDLSQICSMTGLTKDELLQKITGTPEMTSRSEVDTSQQRESHLDLNLGLMDDYTDFPDQSELTTDTTMCEIDSHWFDDCASLRKAVPRCNVCSGTHGSEPCPLLGEVQTNHVSVPIHQTTPMESDEGIEDQTEHKGLPAEDIQFDDLFEPITLCPYSNWYCVNNYIVTNKFTHLLTFLMFLVTFSYSHWFRRHLSVCNGILNYNYRLNDKLANPFSFFSAIVSNFIDRGAPPTLKSFC